MKNRFLLLTVGAICLAISSCKKETVKSSDGTATLNVINGAINVPIMLKMNGTLNTSGNSTSIVSSVNYNKSAFFYAAGKPTDIAILKGTDSSIMSSEKHDLKNEGIYTLLVAGQVPNVQGVLIDDTNLPFTPMSKIADGTADSVIYIRFINLCPDAQPMNVNIQGAATNEVTGLGFKQASAFKAYPGRITTCSGTFCYTTINFEFKENGTVLKTYTMFIYGPYNRFKDVAIVLTGMKTPGPGQPGLNVITANYF